MDQGGGYLVSRARVILDFAIIQGCLFTYDNFIHPRIENRITPDRVEFFHQVGFTILFHDHEEPRGADNRLEACIMNMKNQDGFVKNGIAGYANENTVPPKGSIESGEGVGLVVNQLAKMVLDQR